MNRVAMAAGVPAAGRFSGGSDIPDRLRVSVAVVALATVLNVQGDVIDTSGMAPWERCGYCHGVDGNSVMARFPRLAGQKPGYLEMQLAAFAGGLRRNDDGAMQAVAEQLSAAEQEMVARYFAAQSVADTAAGTVADRVKEIYLQGLPEQSVPACARCHEQQSDAPVLRQQHADYLLKQLNDFAADRRTHSAPVVTASESLPQDQGITMNRIARSLSDRQRQQLAEGLARWSRQERLAASGLTAGDRSEGTVTAFSCKQLVITGGTDRAGCAASDSATNNDEYNH